MGRGGVEPPTNGLKVRKLVRIYLINLTIRLGFPLRKCWIVLNGAGLCPAKFPHAISSLAEGQDCGVQKNGA